MRMQPEAFILRYLRSIKHRDATYVAGASQPRKPKAGDLQLGEIDAFMPSLAYALLDVPVTIEHVSFCFDEPASCLPIITC
jgi:hypothetical protein